MSALHSERAAPRTRIWPWIFLIVILFLISSCALTAYLTFDRILSFAEDSRSTTSRKSFSWGKEYIAELRVEGVILGTRDDLFDSLDEIEASVREKKAKGLLISINSPGGSVAPTQDIYRRIFELRKSIPVICSMGDLAASGGYYLASACQEIYAQPGTTTGSIGVILQYFNMQDLVAWAKLKPVTIKAGKMKDIISPFRPITAEEISYLENLLKEVHEQFIRDVAIGRKDKISPESLREVADGRVITGEQALRLGLVDKNAGLNEALKWLREDQKLGDLDVLRLPRPKSRFSSLFSDMSNGRSLIDQMRPFRSISPMLLPPYFEFEHDSRQKPF